MTLDASRRCTRPLAMFAGSRSAAPQFVIYKSPADYPGKFVVRMWRTHKPADVRFWRQSRNLVLVLSFTGCVVWSGRALQEVLINLADAVLHQCIRPLIAACCAPGHHGYQRAFELISGQASNGPFGSPVFACAGKTDPPSSSHPLADLGGLRGVGYVI